jgi:hypothetical protein
MNKLKVMRQNSGAPAMHLKKGTPVTMNDGWRGVFMNVTDDVMYCDLAGPNPHWTGRSIKMSFVTIDKGKVTADWKLSTLLSSILATVSTSTVDREQRRMADLNRMRLDREWKAVSED